MDILKYKGYEGTAEVDMTRCVCRGKILFINDLVTYEAESPANLQKEFETAVDDYLETCVLLNREPAKPLRGQFNVRVTPELHRAAVLRAQEEGISLNEVVVLSLQSFLSSSTGTNNRSHTHKLVPYMAKFSNKKKVTQIKSNPSQKLKWQWRVVNVN